MKAHIARQAGTEAHAVKCTSICASALKYCRACNLCLGNEVHSDHCSHIMVTCLVIIMVTIHERLVLVLRGMVKVSRQNLCEIAHGKFDLGTSM